MHPYSKEHIFQVLGYVASISVVLMFVAVLWQPLFMAAVIAIMTFPFYERLRWYLGQVWAATVVVILTTCLVIAPFAYGAYYFVQQATQLVILASDETTPEYALLTQFVDQFRPLVENFLGQEMTVDTVVSYLLSKIDTIAGWTQSAVMVVTTGLLGLIFGLAVVLFALFYFLLYGKQLVAVMYKLSPVPREFVERVTDEFWQMTLVMVKMTVIIGVLQGLAGGLGLYAAGTPRVFMWTIVMIFLSIMPVLGAMGVLLPTAMVYAFLLNDYQAALIVTITLVVVTVGDNFLKPLLVGKDMALPGPLVLLGAVAGIPLFGLFGFLYGPIILALPLAYLDVYMTRRNQPVHAEEAKWQSFTPRVARRQQRPKRG